MNTLPVALRNTFAAFSVAALLTACGAGSSGDSTPYQPTTPPATDTSSPDDVVTAPTPDDTTPDSDQGQVEPPAPAPVVDRSATLVWEKPTTNTDGSCLTELAGYRVSYGLSPDAYSRMEALDASDVSCIESEQTDSCGQVVTCSYTVENLDANTTWYFAVQAVDSRGNISDYSNYTPKTIY